MEKGKNYSGNTGRVNKTRNKSDFYQTHYSLVEQFLKVESFDYSKKVLEPCYGKGAVYSVLKKHFDSNNVYFYDLETKHTWYNCELYSNFLNHKENKLNINYLITNPPFRLAGDFIKKAKEVIQDKFAYLLPISYLHGQTRYTDKIFRDEGYPLTDVYVFTRYPMLSQEIREDGKYPTGMCVYGWFVWNNNNSNQLSEIQKTSKLHWIDNNKYVLNSRDKT